MKCEIVIYYLMYFCELNNLSIQQILCYRVNPIEVNAFYMPWKNALGTQYVFLFSEIIY